MAKLFWFYTFGILRLYDFSKFKFKFKVGSFQDEILQQDTILNPNWHKLEFIANLRIFSILTKIVWFESILAQLSFF